MAAHSLKTSVDRLFCDKISRESSATLFSYPYSNLKHCKKLTTCMLANVYFCLFFKQFVPYSETIWQKCKTSIWRKVIKDQTVWQENKALLFDERCICQFGENVLAKNKYLALFRQNITRDIRRVMSSTPSR